MNDIYAAVALVAVAQIMGVYALVTRKADLIFAVAMVATLAAAAALGLYGIYGKLH